MTGNHWHPEGSGVFLETQDGRLDLADVSWQEVAPCGCVSGVMVAATDELIVTAEQAARHSSSAAEYERDKERGYTFRPREHKAAVTEMTITCPHSPQWGYEPAPTPSGFVWAAVNDIGSRPRLTHLVPAVALENVEKRRYGTHSAPLCAGKAQFWWSTEWHVTDGKVECKRCITAAKKRETVPA